MLPWNIAVTQALHPNLGESCDIIDSNNKKESGVHKWDDNGDKAFEKLNTAKYQAEILSAANCEKIFLGHVHAPPSAVGGMPTQPCKNEKVIVIKFF